MLQRTCLREKHLPEGNRDNQCTATPSTLYFRSGSVAFFQSDVKLLLILVDSYQDRY
jgi:hypothetical protein